MRNLLIRLVPFVFLAVIVAAIPGGPSGLSGRPYFQVLHTTASGQASIFMDVNDVSGIASNRIGQERLIGQAWGDIDQDGWPDLYVTDPAGPNILYHNQGDGTFQPMPANSISPLADRKSSGAVFADYDNDGFPDLYVLNRSQPNVLFHNEGGLRFVDVTAAAGVGDPYDGKTASWGDYDSDGLLDLYVANWSCYPDCARSQDGDTDAFFHNLGDGTFENVTQLLGSKVNGGGFVASFVDFDNDGDADLYLVNDVFINERGNALWRNDGPGCQGWCFTEISESAGADTRLMGMGLATTDFDNDGDFDFYFSNAGPMMLLENMGDGSFRDVSSIAGVDFGSKGIAWGTVSLDYDNDGYQDLYLAVTDILPSEEPLNQLFQNRGNGTFRSVSEQSGIGHNGRTIGVASADFDRDGWVDIVIGDYERGYTLFRNQDQSMSNSGRISVRLVGDGPVNRDAIGARVIVQTDNGLTQIQEVQSGSSLGAGNSLILHFGLGQAHIENLTVQWPDGTQQSFSDVPINREYTIRYAEISTGQGWSPGLLTAAFILVMGLVFAVSVPANTLRAR